MNGVLMNKATKQTTKIESVTKFVSDGSGAGAVEVRFQVPIGFQNHVLVAFQQIVDAHGTVCR